MKCPNCQAELKQNDLVGRSTNPKAAWYEITGTELHCPKCNSKLTFTKLPQIIGGIGFIIYVCILLFNLLSPDNPYKLYANLLGLGIFIIGVIYWHRNKKLISVKRNITRQINMDR